MIRSASVIITGQLRNTEILFRSLSQFVELRSLGYIQEIILSTWKSELIGQNELIYKLKSIGVIIVESDQPSRFETPGYFYYQSKTLYMGLAISCKADWILKTRTDVVFDSTETILRIINEDLTLNNLPLNHPFNHRIWTSFMDISTPMFFSDQLFFGNYSDIMKLCSFNALRDVLELPYPMNEAIKGHCNYPEPEIRLFSGPFINNYPIIRKYLEVAHLVTAFGSKNRFDLLNLCFAHQFFVSVLSIYYFIAYNYFKIGGPSYKYRIGLVRSFKNIDNPLESFNGFYLVPHGSTMVHEFANNFTYERAESGVFLSCDDSTWLSNIFNGLILENYVLHEIPRSLLNAIQFDPKQNSINFEAFRNALIDFHGVDSNAD